MRREVVEGAWGTSGSPLRVGMWLRLRVCHVLCSLLAQGGGCSVLGGADPEVCIVR